MDWELVQRRSGLGGIIKEAEGVKSTTDLLIEQELVLIELRHRFLATLKGAYWHEFEQG